MKEIFDRIIARLENISERDDYGFIVNLDDAIDSVFELSDEYDGKFVSASLYDQIKWERDIALEQLEILGIGLGQKIDGVYLSNEQYNGLLEYKYIYNELCK